MADIDSFEMDRALPSHQQRLAAEKKVNVYFIPGFDKNGEPGFVYAVASAMLHEQLVEAVEMGVVPDFAVVVEMGAGSPSEEVKEKIRQYYGFDTDAAA